MDIPPIDMNSLLRVGVMAVAATAVINLYARQPILMGGHWMEGLIIALVDWILLFYLPQVENYFVKSA